MTVCTSLGTSVRDFQPPNAVPFQLLPVTSWKGLVTSPLSVVFDAARDEDYRGMDDYLVFSKLTTNLGNGFDIETGKFTAPVSGLYFFALNVYGQPRDAVIMSIRSGLTQINCLCCT